MKHNDAHIHISGSSPVKGKGFCFEEFLKMKSVYSIERAIVFAHPVREDLYPGEDVVKVLDYGYNECQYVSTKSGIANYVGRDPFHDENEMLIRKCLDHTDIFPFIYLTMTNNTINNELDFFSQLYKNKFFGIKLHPNLCKNDINKLELDSKLPLIVHCGTNRYDHPCNIITFAKQYKGNVCLAHWARFDEATLRTMAQMDNVFLDTSPTYSLNQINEGKNDDRWLISDGIIRTPAKLFSYIVNLIGEDKIMYGSDMPFGDCAQVENFMYSLDISDHIKEKIFLSNFNHFININ